MKKDITKNRPTSGSTEERITSVMIKLIQELPDSCIPRTAQTIAHVEKFVGELALRTGLSCAEAELVRMSLGSGYTFSSIVQYAKLKLKVSKQRLRENWIRQQIGARTVGYTEWQRQGQDPRDGTQPVVRLVLFDNHNSDGQKGPNQSNKPSTAVGYRLCERKLK